MIVRTFIARFSNDSSRAVGRVMLAMMCVWGYYASAETECLAAEIAILKSSSISAYDQAITGRHRRPKSSNRFFHFPRSHRSWKNRTYQGTRRVPL